MVMKWLFEKQHQQICIDTISHLKIYKLKADGKRKYKVIIVLGNYNTRLYNLFLFMCMCVSHV